MNTSYPDINNFLSTLTAKKICNYLKLKNSFFFSNIFKKYYHTGQPSALSVEVTNYCNLNCPECPVGQNSLVRPKGNMKYELFTKIIDETAPCLLYLSLYFQGEPFLTKDIYKMISYASDKKIYTALSTNAQLIDKNAAKRTIESGLNRIIISIDGTSQETYEKYRIGGSLDKVISATENLLFFKQQLKSTTPYVVHQFLVTKDNEHQVSEIKKLSKKLGADYTEYKTIQLSNPENSTSLLPKNEKFSRYKIHENGSISLKKKLKNNCFRSWSSSVITWDGTVLPCCFDKDANHPAGNITNNSLQEIFKATNFTAFRKKILQKRNEIEICTNCTE